MEEELTELQILKNRYNKILEDMTYIPIDKTPDDSIEMQLIRIIEDYRLFKNPRAIEPTKEFKRCPKCTETKKLEYFNKDKSRPDGYQTYCSKCRHDKKYL